MALCLDSNELYDLTGLKQGAAQARWLRSQGYYVECNARGIPRITHAQVEEKRRRPVEQAQTSTTRPTEPNIVGFRQKLNLAA